MSLILDLVFPPKCSGCGYVGQYLCPKCRSRIICKSIRYSHNDKLEGRLSLFRYNGAVKKLITDLKFGYITDLIPEFGHYIYQMIISGYPHLSKYWQDNNFVLIPIPLHYKRQNWRGFNQSALMAEFVSQQLKLKYDQEVFIRTKDTLPQTKIKDKLLRRQNTTSSFKLIKSEYRNIILFDDVYTTGSTLKSAVSIFPAGTKIWGLTIAG
jgi:competence protein ComFC